MRLQSTIESTEPTYASVQTGAYGIQGQGCIVTMSRRSCDRTELRRREDSKCQLSIERSNWGKISEERETNDEYDIRGYKFTWYDVNEWAGSSTRGTLEVSDNTRTRPPWETSRLPCLGLRGISACTVLTSLNERKLSVSALTWEYN